MSSINPYFTFEYSQPEEYHFSHDSVFLARRVFEIYQNADLSKWRCLDLCSGSGVIGLDFLFHLRRARKNLPLQFDFLEVQNIYLQHFVKNKSEFLHENIELNFIFNNYDVLKTTEYKNKYDLIVCNPPYFFVGNGKLSPSDFKNRCRFFIDSNFESLLQAIESSLALGGQAFMLFRNQEQHGFDIYKDINKVVDLSQCIECTKLDPIRGTELICFKKIKEI